MEARLITVFVLAALLPSTNSSANEFLKKVEPNELHVTVGVSPDCSVTDNEALGIVEGVLVRSRIKPLDKWDTDELLLVVSIDCLPRENTNPFYSFDIRSRHRRALLSAGSVASAPTCYAGCRVVRARVHSTH